MPKITIDGPTQIIHIDAGVTEINVIVDIYGEWKRWFGLPDNAKYSEAMFTVGGEPISDTQNVPQFFFLINGWRIHVDSGETVKIGVNLYTFNGDGILYVTSNNSQVIADNSTAVVVNPANSDVTALLLAIKSQTDKFTFIASDVVATLDNEEVKTDQESRDESKADIAPLL